jgi:hypothetical protein
MTSPKVDLRESETPVVVRHRAAEKRVARKRLVKVRPAEPMGFGLFCNPALLRLLALLGMTVVVRVTLR